MKPIFDEKIQNIIEKIRPHPNVGTMFRIAEKSIEEIRQQINYW
jgi:predicted RNA-binding protein